VTVLKGRGFQPRRKVLKNAQRLQPPNNATKTRVTQGITMSNRRPTHYIHHPKLRGEWAELHFILRAIELGLILSRLYGDNAPYDLV
jgi:hypothetical protein